MEWWETPGSEYDSYLSEGIIKKGVGAFAAYQVGKRALPWMAKKGIDMVHGAADTGNQLYQRAQDPQSHNRPDDYRYPAKKPNPNDGKVAKEGWDGLTVDEYGNPVYEEADYDYVDEFGNPVYEVYEDAYGYLVDVYGNPVYEQQDGHKRNKQIAKAEKLAGTPSYGTYGNAPGNAGPKLDLAGVKKVARSDGFTAGKKFGYEKGYTHGSEDGYESGYHEGKMKGSAIGKEKGKATGRSEGAAVARKAKLHGFKRGFSKGETAGFAKGHTAGFGEGHAQGKAEGEKIGYGKGHTAGFGKGRTAGLKTGRWQGAAAGAAVAGAGAALYANRHKIKDWASKKFGGKKAEVASPAPANATKPTHVKGQADTKRGGYSEFEANGYGR